MPSEAEPKVEVQQTDPDRANRQAHNRQMCARQEIQDHYPMKRDSQMGSVKARKAATRPHTKLRMTQK